MIALVDTAWVNIHRRLDAYVATWLFTMAAGDIAITGALSASENSIRTVGLRSLTGDPPAAYHLNQVRSEFDTTKSLVDRIVRTIVANNALVRPRTSVHTLCLSTDGAPSPRAQTAVSAIASGILFVSSRNTGWHVIFGITLARLYTLSFLSSREPSPLCPFRALSVPPPSR